MDFIVGGIIVVILGLAIGYIIKQKKNGARCIGCGSAGSCSANLANKNKNSSCQCGTNDNIS